MKRGQTALDSLGPGVADNPGHPTGSTKVRERHRVIRVVLTHLSFETHACPIIISRSFKASPEKKKRKTSTTSHLNLSKVFLHNERVE